MPDRASTSFDTRSAGHRRLVRAGAFAWFVLAAALTTADAADDSLVTIQDRIWGFDGRVHTGQFNPVSFLIDNRTDESIDAIASLSQSAIIGTTSGRFQQPVFIGPGAQRWVQLYPYIASDGPADWTLSLGDLEFRGLQQPRSTTVMVSDSSDTKPKPAAIILDAPGTMSLQPVTVKHFPEAIFPPWATATFGLHTIFMDHEPDWEIPRQEAMMSWLRRGGRLHLLKNSRGAWPTFSGQLADLSQPLDSFVVGNGTVTRHDAQRGDLTESMVRASLGTDEDDKPDEFPEEQLTVNSSNSMNASMYQRTDLSWLDDNWFEAMRQFTQPSHAWWLIFLLALVYIGSIFPGCWLLARQNRHFLTVYGAIAGLSIVFSLLFLLIGRRGYGEFTTQHTLAISRIEDSTTQNVMEWNSLFVTSGDQYTITGTDEQSLFAVPHLQQQTNAVMVGGNDGRLSVGIPPFSTQTFVCRRQLPMADWQLEVLSFRQPSGGIADLQLKYGPAFEVIEKAEIRLQHRRVLYRATCDESAGLIRQTGRIASLAKFCNDYYQNSYTGYGWGPSGTGTADTFYDEVLPAVILRSLTDDGIYDPREFDLPADRVRLFVYTTLAADHFVETNTNSQKRGRILYVCDIPLRKGGQRTGDQ